MQSEVLAFQSLSIYVLWHVTIQQLDQCMTLFTVWGNPTYPNTVRQTILLAGKLYFVQTQIFRHFCLFPRLRERCLLMNPKCCQVAWCIRDSPKNPIMLFPIQKACVLIESHLGFHLTVGEVKEK